MMKKPTFQKITEAEQRWIESQLAAGTSLVAQYSSSEQGLSLEALDAAWAAWMATAPTNTNDINNAINGIGISFGSLLVATGEFEWCIATDEWGTDLAVRALPARGDILVYPADFVSKRWETRTANFLADTFPKIVEHVSATKKEWGDSGGTC